MNERIKELWLDAARHAIIAEPTDYVAQKSIVPAKFAELIVRECVKESMEEIVSDDEIIRENDPLIREYFKGNNQGIVDAVVRFRNHLGVEL